jgi:hypothetical protein
MDMADIATLLTCYSFSTAFVIIGIASLVYALRRRQTFYENYENWVFAFFAGLATAVTVLGVLFYFFSIGACLYP